VVLQTNYMPAKTLMGSYRPGSYGDEWTWLDEKADLFSWDSEKMNELIQDLKVNGMMEPVLLGDDGRVWDGHHRIIAAMKADVPVLFQKCGDFTTNEEFAFCTAKGPNPKWMP